MPEGPVQSVLIDPDPCAWRGRVERWAGRRPDEAAAFRRQLGLCESAPLVMTGHQAQVWHCGVLAKYFALDAFARHIGAEAAWVVPDQDAHAGDPIEAPFRRTDGSLKRAEAIAFAPDEPEVAAACAPALEPRPGGGAGVGVHRRWARSHPLAR